MDKNTVNRLTEALTFLCIAAAVFILFSAAGAPAEKGSLAGLTVQAVPDEDLERFHALLKEARQRVDTNLDPEPFLGELKTAFPGRHETWALSARYRESRDQEKEALTAYARALRLQPDYLDEGSSLFLGKRIEALNEKVMGELNRVRSGEGLDREGKELLRTAYFVKRRLAGGCE